MENQETENANSEEQNFEKKDCQGTAVSAVNCAHNHMPKEIRQTMKKKQCEEEKLRKGNHKNLERLLKDTNMQSAEEKLHVICKEYSTLYDENKKLQATLKQHERKINNFQKEKKQLQDEQSRALLIRKRLESLCRELQKENNHIKTEGFSKIKEGEQSRKVLSKKIFGDVAQLTALTNCHMQKNIEMLEGQMDLREKSEALTEQMVKIQEEFWVMKCAMKMEAQLANANITKLISEATAEKEEYLREKHQLLTKIKDYQEQIREHQGIENDLRSQVNLYAEKYGDFQNVLSRSDKIYGEFNKEIQRMSQKILSLEKEIIMWKERSVKNHTALQTAVTEKQAREVQIVKLNEELTLLQNICRSLQRERKTEPKKKSLKHKLEMPSAETMRQSSQQNEIVQTSNNILENNVQLKCSSDDKLDAQPEVAQKTSDNIKEKLDKAHADKQIENALRKETYKKLNDDTKDKETHCTESEKTITNEMNSEVNDTNVLEPEQPTDNVAENSSLETKKSEDVLATEVNGTNIIAKDEKELANVHNRVESTDVDIDLVNRAEHENSGTNQMPNETRVHEVDNVIEPLGTVSERVKVQEVQNVPTIVELKEDEIPEAVDEIKNEPEKSENTDA